MVRFLVSSPPANTLIGYDWGAKGRLEEQQRRTFAEWAPGPVTSTPTMVYVGCRGASGGGAVLSLSNPDLELLGTTLLPGSPTYLAEAQGWLFAAFYHEGLLTVSQLDAGGVAESPLLTVDGLPKCHCVALAPWLASDPAKIVVLAAVLELNMLKVYEFCTKTRTLKHIEDVPAPNPGSGPRHIELREPNVFVINELSSHLDWYRYEKLGACRLVASTPTVTAEDPWSADVHVLGDAIFVCDRRTSEVTGYRTADDSLEEAWKYTTAATQPRGFCSTAEGALIVAGQKATFLEVIYADGTRACVDTRCLGCMWVHENKRFKQTC